MIMNSNNFIGWLQLAIDVLDLEPWMVRKIKKYINRTDIIRRQKELDEIFGGEQWLILPCAEEEIVIED